MRSELLIVGHKGAPDEITPENTLASFARSVSLGVGGVEVDVQRTLDDRVVASHHLEYRKRNGELGFISQESYPDLLEEMPHLALFEDVVKLCYEANIRLIVDVRRQNRELLDGVRRVLDRQNAKRLDLEFTSSFAAALLAIKNEMPQARTSLFFTDKDFQKWMRQTHIETTVLDPLELIKADKVNLPLNILRESFIALLDSCGYGVHAGTVDTEDDLETVIRLGIKALTTNNPALIVAAYEKFRLR